MCQLVETEEKLGDIQSHFQVSSGDLKVCSRAYISRKSIQYLLKYFSMDQRYDSAGDMIAKLQIQPDLFTCCHLVLVYRIIGYIGFIPLQLDP